jgi:F0F1-type ATP synthase assembly protein I
MAMDLGVRLGSSVVGGLLIGYFADRWLHTSPLLTFAGLTVGLGAAGYSVWVVSKRYLGE